MGVRRAFVPRTIGRGRLINHDKTSRCAFIHSSPTRSTVEWSVASIGHRATGPPSVRTRHARGSIGPVRLMTADTLSPMMPSRDIAWLKRFWLASAATLALVALFALIAGVLTNVGALAGGALVLAAFGIWLTVSRRRVREGQEARFVILAGVGQYVLMLSLLPLVPELAAIIVPAVLIPVFVASSYLSRAAMTRYAAAVWVFCVAYALSAYMLVHGTHSGLIDRLSDISTLSEESSLLALHLGRTETAEATQLVGAVIVTGFMLALLRGYAQANERARFLAAHDGLTGLPTRALFMDRLEHALERGKRHGSTTGVVFLDVDAFKAINDGHGHGYGDEILRRVAARIGEITRASDTTARLGGDEFAILLEDLEDMAHAESAAARVRQALKEPIDMPEGSFPVVLSMGVAFSGVGGETADALLRSADDAMYESKRRGLGELVAYEPAMRVASAERVAVKRSFEGVVERGELRLQFQPLVKIHDGGHLPNAAVGSVVAVEALVRWNDPSRGWRMPAQFVSLAEETGDIVPIGRWVLREATRHVAEWRRSTPEADLRVTVNLSGRQLVEDAFIEDVVAALESNRLPPAALVLEISEQLLERDTPRIEAVLGELRDLGVGLAIDDFGTGYSSLGSLKDFPVDMMKIDRSLLTDAVDDRVGTAVLGAAVDVGMALDAEVVGEGIETREQLGLLRSLGCEVGQGYFFARPLGPSAMATLLQADAKSWDGHLGHAGSAARASSVVAGSSTVSGNESSVSPVFPAPAS
jgi:diguanylate cyclase (GGDEF)-like protein